MSGVTDRATAREAAPAGRHSRRATPAPTGRGGFRPDIEGLRALAILPVLAYHATNFLNQGASAGLLAPLTATFGRVTGGFLGVDVFFVISGYLITGLLVEEAANDGRIHFGRFYARRARRILPAATVTLLAALVGSAFVLSATRAVSASTDVLWASLFNADIHFGVSNVDYMGVSVAPSPVLHFWSLNDEEKFYLVWPAVLAAVTWAAARRRSAHRAPTASRPPMRALAFLALLLIGALSLLWSQHQVAVQDAAGYYAAPSRAFELAAGGLLAIASPLLVRLPTPVRVAGAIVGFLTIAFCMLTFTSLTPFPGYHALSVVIGSVLVIAGHPAGVVARGLSTGWVRWVGRVSYSLYLWHWPVFVLAAAAAGGLLTPMQDVACVVASFVLAGLSYYLVERPPQRSGWLRPTRNALVFGLVAILVTAASALALGHRSTAVVAASDERAARGITHVAVKDTSLLWIGDSITTRGAGPLRAALRAAGWDYTIDGLGGRPLVSGKRSTWNPSCNGAARCGGDLVLDSAKVPGTVVVALGSNAMELVQVRVHAPTATDSGLRRKLDSRGRWVVKAQDSPAQIAAQVATLARMVPRTTTLYFVGLWLDDSHWGNVTWRQSNAAIRRAVAQFPNAHFLDWGGYVEAHHVPYTADGSHPNPDGMVIRARWLVSQVR